MSATPTPGAPELSGETRGRLAGKHIIVTGAGRGMGRAACLRLASDGASVAALDIDEAAAQAVAAEIAALGVPSVGVRCDVGDEVSVREAVATSVTALGPLAGVFANAGLGGTGALHELSLTEWDRIITVNLTGVFLTLKHTLPELMAAGGGSIVTTGSLSSVVATPGAGAASYKASKGGVNMLTKSVAVDYADYGIRANCLCPGAVDTEFASHAIGAPPVAKRDGAAIPRVVAPMNRKAHPAEIASVLSFLLSDDASYVTGTTMMVDGGYTAI